MIIPSRTGHSIIFESYREREDSRDHPYEFTKKMMTS